jgi:hypothetical protein
MDQILKHKREFAADLASGDYEVTPEGVVFPRKSAIAVGEYFHTVNGGDEQISKNMIVDQGILHFLDVVLGAASKISAWYLAPYATAITPAANWTAANFTANSGENTSTTEGFVETTRVLYVPAAAAAGAISNLASRAAFTVNCTTSININGAGLLSSNVRGGTTGVLVSATRFAAQRVLFDDDIFELGYRVTLTG